jgi:hypothetical protein
VSLHINYRIACESYFLASALGLSHDEIMTEFPVSKCVMLSKHATTPVAENEARSAAREAGWVRREQVRHGKQQTFDICPACAPKIIELQELRVAEAVLSS